MNGMNFLWAPEGMTIDQLNRHYKSVLMSFYSQAKIPWYYTKLTLQHTPHVFRLLRFFWVMSKAKLGQLLGRKGAPVQYAQIGLD
jgi:hypothetical protein